MPLMVVLHLLVMLELVCAAPLGPDDNFITRVNQLEHELSLLHSNGGSHAVDKDRLAELDKQLATVHKQWDSLQSHQDENFEEDGLSATESIYITNKAALLEESISKTFQIDIVIDDDLNKVIGEMKAAYNASGNYSATILGATSIADRKWPGGVIPYVFHGSVGRTGKTNSMTAMRQWMDNTCIKFVPRNSSIHDDYIVFTERHSGCSSYVGKRGNGQPLSLGLRWQHHCKKVKTIVHELGHAVGFWHEHTRPDRDKYIKINWNNIGLHNAYNFFTLPTNDIDSMNVTYDYKSIMHYEGKTFAIRYGLKSMEPLQRGVVLGKAKRLSASDIEQAKMLYDCPTESPNVGSTSSLNTVSTRSTSDTETSPYSHIYGITLRNTNGCLSARIDRSLYDSGNPVNAMYRVSLTDCKTAQSLDVWQWNPYNKLKHMSTGLCLSFTTNDDAVLLPCSKLDSGQDWFCDGKAIIQPSTLKRLTAVSSSPDSGERHVTVVLQSTTFDSDPNQQWRAYSIDNKQITTCPYSHQISECYFQSTEKSRSGWVKCDILGYFVAGVQYNTFKLKTLAQLLCCTLQKSDTNQIWKRNELAFSTKHFICEHQQLWVSAAQEKLACNKGSFLRGVQLGSSSRTRSSVVLGECCWLKKRANYYHHCYSETLDSDELVPFISCRRTGYYITSIVKRFCSHYTCSHKITCCTF